ncbi:hypothetical protein VE00_07922 [Pseudogymnoascus sp. WSF 3629]|nr:hypothetical protein VE00_07922 [Pseudogymnoascus sp. WSF 3629]
MVTTAIAGGGSGIGRVIAEAILNSKRHKVIVLSRSNQPDLASQGVDVRIVDYGSGQQLKEALAGVHTVISCISTYAIDSTSAELNLLEGAKQAGVVRFVPSEWATDCHDVVDLYSSKDTVWQAVKSSGMEYTRFINGLWMNVWGPGCIREEDEALAGYRGRPPFAIDLQAGTATFPGDGSQKVALTTMQDIGRFVAASLELPKWQPESRIVGDKLSFVDVAHLVKTICGQDLRITCISVEELSTILEGEQSVGERFYYQLLLAVAQGRMDFQPTLNDLFPDIKPVSVAEYLKKHWTSE